MSNNHCDTVPLLCSCGWGRLGILACKVPDYCPVCSYDFRRGHEEECCDDYECEVCYPEGEDEPSTMTREERVNALRT